MRKLPHESEPAWVMAMDLSLYVHRLAERVSEYEESALASAMNKAGLTVPQKLAAAQVAAEHHKALDAATTALFELDTAAQLARRLGAIRNIDLSGLRKRTVKLLPLIEALTVEDSTADERG
jgi:four helix bundle protein